MLIVWKDNYFESCTVLEVYFCVIGWYGWLAMCGCRGKRRGRRWASEGRQRQRGPWKGKKSVNKDSWHAKLWKRNIPGQIASVKCRAQLAQLNSIDRLKAAHRSSSQGQSERVCSTAEGRCGQRTVTRDQFLNCPYSCPQDPEEEQGDPVAKVGHSSHHPIIVIVHIHLLAKISNVLYLNILFHW